MFDMGKGKLKINSSQEELDKDKNIAINKKITNRTPERPVRYHRTLKIRKAADGLD